MSIKKRRLGLGCITVLLVTYSGAIMFGLLMTSKDTDMSTQVQVLLVTSAIISGIIGFIVRARRLKRIQQDRDQFAANIRKKVENKDIKQFLNENETFYLYLRPFSKTGTLSVAEGNYFNLLTEEEKDFEFYLAKFIDKIGILISLGKPGEFVGSARIRTEEYKWRDTFANLASIAKLVFIIPSYHKGTLWEMRWLIKNNLISKAIFIMLPQLKDDWDQTMEASEKIGLNLPEYNKNGLVFNFNSNGKIFSAFQIGNNPGAFRKVISITEQYKYEMDKGININVKDSSTTQNLLFPKNVKWLFYFHSFGGSIIATILLGGLSAYKPIYWLIGWIFMGLTCLKFGNKAAQNMIVGIKIYGWSLFLIQTFIAFSPFLLSSGAYFISAIIASFVTTFWGLVINEWYIGPNLS